MTDVKKCTKCEEVKPLEEFHRDRARKDGRQRQCKTCVRERDRLRNLENPGLTAKRRARRMLIDPEKVKADDARWYQNKKAARVSPVVRKQLLEAYPECCNCESTDNLTVDHIKPQSKGGTNDWDNLQVLCVLCNSRKHDKEVDYRKNPLPDPRVTNE